MTWWDLTAKLAPVVWYLTTLFVKSPLAVTIIVPESEVIQSYASVKGERLHINFGVFLFSTGILYSQRGVTSIPSVLQSATTIK